MNGNDTVGCGGGGGCEGVNGGGCGCGCCCVGGIIHVGHDTDDGGCVGWNEGGWNRGGYEGGCDGSYGGGHCFGGCGGNSLNDVDFEYPSRTDLFPSLICSLRSSSLIDIGCDSS